MSLWRTSDDNIRWLVVIGIINVLTTVQELYQSGALKPALDGVAQSGRSMLGRCPARKSIVPQRLVMAAAMANAKRISGRHGSYCLPWTIYSECHSWLRNLACLTAAEVSDE